MLDKIPFWWKVGAFVFGFLSLWAGIGGTYIYALKYGEDKYRLERENINLKAENETIKNTLESFQNAISDLQRREDEIRDSPLANPPLGDNMRASLDRLRCEQNKRNGKPCH